MTNIDDSTQTPPGYWFGVIEGRLHERMRDALADLGLRRGSWRILHTLSDGPASAEELADRLPHRGERRGGAGHDRGPDRRSAFRGGHGYGFHPGWRGQEPRDEQPATPAGGRPHPDMQEHPRPDAHDPSAEGREHPHGHGHEQQHEQEHGHEQGHGHAEHSGHGHDFEQAFERGYVRGFDRGFAFGAVRGGHGAPFAGGQGYGAFGGRPFPGAHGYGPFPGAHGYGPFWGGHGYASFSGAAAYGPFGGGHPAHPSGGHHHPGAERGRRRGHRIDSVLADFVERGWVWFDGDRATLTDEGRAAHDRAFERVQTVRAELANGLAEGDYAVTMATLEAMARNLGWRPAAPHEAGSDGAPNMDA